MKGRRPPAAINVMTLPLICSSADRPIDRHLSQLTESVKSVGHIAAADGDGRVAPLMMRRRPSEVKTLVSVSVQHVRVGISRLIRRRITLLLWIHRSRLHHSDVVLLRRLWIVALGQIVETGAEIRRH